MEKVVGAVSFAALIGFLICAALLAGDALRFGFAEVWGTRLGHLAAVFGLTFSHSFPVAMVLTFFKTPRHIRVYERAFKKVARHGIESLTARERTCYIAFQAHQHLMQEGLDAGVNHMGEAFADEAARVFSAIGLPRLAHMLEDYLETLKAGAFDALTPEERPTYESTCHVIEGRMRSAGLAKVPKMLDEVLRAA